jgi:hypothetical protein
MRDRVVLGGAEFVAQWRGQARGNAREQFGLARLGPARPPLVEVIARVEAVRGESWRDFRDRHGDSGRDLVLYLGRRVCGLKLGELAQAAGMREYGAVAVAIRRYEQRLPRQPVERKQMQRVCQMLNIQM